MSKNYNNKTKHRSAWFALVLLMITALPITAQNVGDRFQVGTLWYEVVDATKHTVKVTYANENLDKAKARQLKFDRNLDYVNNGTKGGDDKADGTYKGYSGKLNNTITIPETVKDANGTNWKVVAIGTCAFINERGFYVEDKVNNKEKRIRLDFVLPSTIEHIEEAAFYQAYACTINFPEGLKTIGRQAFYRTVVGYYYTYRNTKFRRQAKTHPTVTITIPGQTAIGPQAFEQCSTAGATLSCPNIRYLGYQAFKGSGFLMEVPKSANLGVKPAGTDTEITDLYKTLPGVDQRSGVEAFAGSISKSVTLQDGITTIPTGMFDKAFRGNLDKNNIKKFEIPLSVTTIEERAFANAGILSFSELSVVKKIGARAFENGKLAGDFVVLDNVEEIGNEAFKGNELLTGFTLKGSDNCTVGAGFLEGCTNVEYLDLRDVNSTVVKNNLKNLSREANSTTITAGLPTHTLVYLPNVSDISIAAGQDVNFVKSGGTCTKLVLVDGADYEFPYAITAYEVVYQRDLPSLSHFIEGKNCFTIFLPYAVKLPKGIRAYNLDYLNKKGNTETYMFKSIPDKDKDILKANTPYLLRITDGKTHSSEKFEAVGNPVVIAASGEKLPKSKLLKPQCFVKAESDQSYAFYGSTERTSIYWYKDGNIGGETNKDFCPWVLNVNYPGKDVWRQYATKKEEFVPPFRGFILRIPGTPGAKQFTVLSEGETTGISDVTGNTDVQQGAQRIYTMDGRYVGTDFDSLPSGMYIMKGKKTLKTK
ncbi:leucine-rich repeat domain-containing protein [Hallella colorans]|uniref:Leucine rich repeat (LRR) protein n=1 Tax=Hallella colorans TaxID=1703337 RepID=A0A2U0U1C3_9BACT|nr:leucine-rich repeat domain-containing protein [Hallella colorans]PVX49751.1 leucine rich repeat (LRR) protein [Hallella colorans]